MSRPQNVPGPVGRRLQTQLRSGPLAQTFELVVDEINIGVAVFSHCDHPPMRSSPRGVRP